MSKQGPALYAYNNARFTREDWRGIRLVCDSIKVEDPMKVGRFGLGFKSVFHMTGMSSTIDLSNFVFMNVLNKFDIDLHLKPAQHKVFFRELRPNYLLNIL